MSERRDICGHEKDDGELCEVNFGLCPEEGCRLCWSHCSHRAEERQAARSQGGKQTKKRYGASGLTDEDLPPLDSPENAERWLEIVGRAVGRGDLSYKDGRVMVQAVKEFLRSQHKDLEPEMEELQKQFEELQARVKRADLKAMD